MQHDRHFYNDADPAETREWLEALESVLEREGPERAAWLLRTVTNEAQALGALRTRLDTPYVNTIAPKDEAPLPGDMFVERRIRSLIRWNALAMVVRANVNNDDHLGGHIASFASSATLYEVGFNHFFHAAHDDNPGDLIFFQGHSAPGFYARAYLEGRISEEQLNNFRREVDGKGLSSYPHPWLMPDFWQFPTVSMGLGPMQAIYQAHIMNYLQNRELIKDHNRKVWAFLGDGEMDEPESLGALALAGREHLDNLIFVVNCNLQRLDGPVRGNGKIIQELESIFRGAGWNVIKVIWGRRWDPLLEKDQDGLLRQRMEECVDGEYQAYKSNGGEYTREHFFGKYPELKKMVEHMSDDDIYRLNRGGHDPFKIYAAYHAAVHHTGQPTVILAKTVKGYATGAGEAVNKAHQIKQIDLESLKEFRDRFDIPVPDDKLEELPYYHPGDDSAEIRYMKERRQELGGYIPMRRREASGSLTIPTLDIFSSFLEGSGDRELSTTMAFVRMLSALIKDKSIGERIVPIIPDEARTFGMDGMFRQLGIYSSKGQKYVPEDSEQLMYYREDKKGRILEEGINEAGAMSGWIAAATSYSVHNFTLIPFFIYYSMFGYQRTGDFWWAAGDSQARGFLLGGTAGRTTLNGEGLQHQDGHSMLLADVIPNCVSYDPTYAYELAVILQDGLRRMYQDHENIYYYLTLMNENYRHGAMPKGAEDGIRKGMYLLREGKGKRGKKTLSVQLLSSGTILPEVEAAADLLREDFGIVADVWSVTSFNELRREGLRADRERMLKPDVEVAPVWIEQCLDKRDGPVIAATDYIKAYADQIRPWIKAPYRVLGTDGFGRSDSRAKLREFFEVDRHFVVLAALSTLRDMGKVDNDVVKQAISKYGIDPEKPYPVTH